MQIIDTTASSSTTVQVGTRPNGDLMDAHKQWAKRPKEDWCMDAEQMLERTGKLRHRSHEGKVLDLGRVAVIGDNEGLRLRGPEGGIATVSHLGFQQLASRVGAPASYLRGLPPLLAAQCMNEGIRARADHEDASGLVPLWYANHDEHGKLVPHLRALTTEKYARVWDYSLAQKLAGFMERHRGWGAAEAFRTAKGTADRAWGQRQALPLAFVGEDGFFAFCVNYERPVEVEGSTLVPGFFLRNSETGTAAIEAVFFFFDFACSNMIVWGAKNVRTVKIRHVGQAERRALDDYGEVQTELAAQAEASSLDKIETIKRARRTLVADTKEDVIDRIFRGFDVSKRAVEAAYEVAEQTPRYGDPRSAWAVVNGLTEVSQRASFGADRVDADRTAGKILEKFAF
jgi:hypothetical protein